MSIPLSAFHHAHILRVPPSRLRTLPFQVINHWAYIYCALTGESLVEGGRDALKLFVNRGFTAIINDDLIG